MISLQKNSFIKLIAFSYFFLSTLDLLISFVNENLNELIKYYLFISNYCIKYFYFLLIL